MRNDPRSAAAARSLNTYFSGINSKDPVAALSVMDPTGTIDPNDPAQVDAFARGTATSRDSKVRMGSIRAVGSRMIIAVTRFTSHQGAHWGPEGERCTNWTIGYRLIKHGSRYLIGRIATVYHVVC